ncbi:uncharacterized protein LOC141827175 [Curcuma longa]|uniref:uncharacterized protein LOC141827175 n=1 Tax=Curcuma longa TaxID=136217 RepID=UPI003D9DD91B
MHHLGILFLILASYTASSASAASHGEISYAKHCGDTVPESEATALVVKHFDHTSFRNGYFSGGAGLFSPVDTSAVFAPPSVNFQTKSLHKTKKNDTFRIQAAMTLFGASQKRRQHRRRFDRSPHAVADTATFEDLAGFWSESTGKVCMVGRGVYSDAQGKSLLLSAVLILNFPTVSNLNTSLIDGEVEILNSVGEPNNFGSIAVLAYYASNPYHFTIFPQATSSCSAVKIEEDSLEIEPFRACIFLSNRVFRIDFKNSADCSEGSCLLPTENGSTNFYLEFSNSSSFSFDMPMIPERSLVGEAYWDRRKKQFCLLACRVINADSPDHPHVGACDVGLTLWFPTVMTLKERSDVVGRIWSNKDKKDAEYFDMASIYSLNDGLNRIHGLKYKRTSGIRSSAVLVDSAESWNAANTSIWNVGFEITNPWYRFDDDDDDDFEINELAAEGVYNSATGRICMKGCRYPKQQGQRGTLDYESIDCEISISIQLAPLDEDAELHLDGTISSTRIQSEPLYFGTINISSTDNMGRREIDRSVWRMDVELIMVIITLTFSCICIALQIFHVKKQPHILPSVSITMLLVLVLGYTIPLVLNFEALLIMHRTSGSSRFLRRRRWWISAHEVIVRMISIVGLFLALRLTQLAWSSRSSAAAEDSRKSWAQERRALKWCLPLYAAGALLAWLLSFEWKALISYSGFVIDGFLLPQIVFNMARQCKGKVLTPFFYVGIVATRALPHLYDVYRSRSYVAIESTNIYGSEAWDFYSTAWDIIIPCEGLLLASLVYLQQRFGSEWLVPKRLRMHVYQYEEVAGATI